MADDWGTLYGGVSDTDSPTWGDYGRAVKSGAEDLGAGAGAVARMGGESFDNPVLKAAGRYVQKYLNDASEDDIKNMTPSARERISAAVSDPAFWSHPLSASMLKGAQMTPMIAASLLPGGLIGEAGAAVAFGGMNMADSVNNLYGITDKLSDEDLRKQFPYYDQLRSTGMSEDDAREQANSSLRGWTPAINFAVGAVAGALGPIAGAARAVTGRAGALGGEGIIGRAASGAGEGALAMGAQSGVENITQQQAQIQAGSQKEFDKDALASAVLEGAVMGGVPGGLLGAAFKGHAKERADGNKAAEEPVTDTTAPANVSPPPKSYGTGNTPPPREDVEVGNPQSTPTRSERDYKTDAAPTIDKEILPTQPASPDVAQQAAAAVGPPANQKAPDAASIAKALFAQQEKARQAEAAKPPIQEPVEQAPAAPMPTQPAPENNAPVAAPVARPEPTALQTIAKQQQIATERPNAGSFQQMEDRAGVTQPQPDAVKNAPNLRTEVTPQGNQPAQPAEQRAPKVLKPIDAESKKVVKAQNNAIAKNLKDADQPEAETASRSHKSKAEQEAKQASQTTAAQVVERHVQQPGEDDAAVLARAKSMVEEAKQNGVKIPVVLKGTPSPEMVVLREAADLVRASGTKKWLADNKYRTERFSRFRTREAAARGGAVEEAVAERRAEGDTVKRAAQQNVEEAAQPEIITGASAGETKRVGVLDSETKVGDGELRGVSAHTEEAEVKGLGKVERAKAASEVRRPQLSDEEKAAILAKYAPKTAAVKERIEAAAKKADTAPTEAQKAAGNYEKGHVSIHGLDVTIENPRGSERTGKAPDGTEWSVKMPDHYGYIKRTEGADGDHVDTFVGPHPESPHAFVIDQLHPDTGKFDEHKVFLGYHNAQHALDAYHDSFSDKSGPSRYGGIQAMTIPALKDWLHSSATKKPLEAAAARAPTKSQVVVDNSKMPKPTRTGKLGDLLDTVTTDHLKGINRVMAGFMARRLKEVVGDTPFSSLTNRDMAAWTGRSPSDVPGGMWRRDVKDVVFNEDHFKDPLNNTHIILHEATHAAMQRVIDRSPEARAVIKQMMKETQDWVQLAGGADQKYIDYAMNNEHEFMSEANSNPSVQSVLSEIDASQKLKDMLGLGRPKKLTVWDALVGAVRHFLKMPARSHSMLEAVMRLNEHVMEPQREFFASRAAAAEPEMAAAGNRVDAFGGPKLVEGAIRGAKDAAGAFVEHPVTSVGNAIKTVADRPGVKALGKRVANDLTTTNQFVQKVEAKDADMGEYLRKVHELTERQGVAAQRLKKPGERLVARFVKAARQDPEKFNEFSRLMNDETMYGVDASAKIGEGRNSYLALSKENAKKAAKGKLNPADVNSAHWAAHGAYDDLVARYKEITAAHPDWADLHEDAFKFFHDAQQEMAHGHIDEFLRAAGVDVAGRSQLARQILNSRVDDDFRGLLESSLGRPITDSILAAKKLAGKEGPYVPLMRHGDYVVGGKYKVSEPANAIRKVDDSTWEFKTREEAHKFAESTDLPYTADTAYYDPVTGERTTKVGGISQAGTPEQRWEVKVQRQHTSFHDTVAEANAEKKALHESGLFEAEPYVQEKQDIFNHMNEISGGALAKIVQGVQRSDEYLRATKAQQAEMLKSIRDAAIATRAGNKVQSRRLPRRKVAGASDDLPRNLEVYNNSQANYRAKIQYRPQIEEALQSMHQFVKDSRYDSRSALDPRTMERSQIANEMERRARAEDPNEYTGAYTNATRRIMTWSYISRMMRPSHLILHQTHLPMITAPYMAGRHGALQTYTTIARTWRRLMKFYTAGAADVKASALDGLHEGTNFVNVAKDRFAGDPDGARVNKMLGHLDDIGVIHPQSGIEISKFQPYRQVGGAMGAMDTVINKMDTVFRHATNATEAINRVVGAVSAYRLEYAKQLAKGLDEDAAHEAATKYARDTIANTQGYYTPTNAAPLFKNKALRPFLQFRQFPQMMYHLLIQNATRVFKGASKEERVQAAASLLGVLGAHTLMTGLLGGLPLEAAKIGGLITKGLGVTPGDWNDVERGVYDKAVDMFGKEGADYVMHGVSRHLFGVDVHHRLGLNSFFTFGLPDKADKTDILAFIASQAMGAPEGLAEDAVHGLSQMMNGDIAGGAARAFPSQALRDIEMAIKGSNNSGKYKYSPAERVGRVLGFTPAGEAQQGERAAEMYQERAEYTNQRNALIKSWVTGSDKSGAWAAIQRFNSAYPQAPRITMAQLHQAAQRASNPSHQYNGVSMNKQTQWIADRDRATYPQ